MKVLNFKYWLSLGIVFLLVGDVFADRSISLSEIPIGDKRYTRSNSYWVGKRDARFSDSLYDILQSETVVYDLNNCKEKSEALFVVENVYNCNVVTKLTSGASIIRTGNYKVVNFSGRHVIFDEMIYQDKDGKMLIGHM